MPNVDLDSAVVVHDAEAAIDPELRRRGEPHLQAVRTRSPGMFDGPVLALDRIEDGVVHAVHASYFDMVATCDALAGDPGLRAYAEQLAAPDPLRIGRGRAAAIGVTAIVVRRLERSGTTGMRGSRAHGSRVHRSSAVGSGVRGFTLGHRSADLALDPGRWHVVPSGVIEPRGLIATLADELADEHGIHELPTLRLIALGHDAARLRPELTVMTGDLGAIPPPRPSHEFDAFREVPLDLEAIAAARALDLTPAAELALAAVEHELRR
jgi:hypothetical protein